MALDDDGVVLPGRGYLFYNPTPGAASPFTAATVGAANLDAATVATGWSNFGHTSRENSVKLNRDAEEGEVKGTWQKPNLRKTDDQVSWSFTIPSVQMSNHTFDMYFGEGDKSEANAYWVKGTAPTIEGALTLVLVDGAKRVPIYVPKVAYSGDDAPEFGVDDFVELSIKATVLEQTGAKGLMAIYKAGLGSQTP